MPVRKSNKPKTTQKKTRPTRKLKPRDGAMPKPSFTHTYQTPSQRKTYSQEEQTRKATLAGEVIHPSEFKSGRATWRIFRIMAEFVEGYNFLSKLTADITIFGSARTKPGEKYYKVAEKLGRLLAQEGFSVITGGGPGIMEAANKGAYEAGGESIGLGVQLPFEQRMNDYILHGIGFNFFFTRKVMLTSPSQAFIAFPGGYGTIDEIFEVLTLIKTHKMQPVPVILVGKEFWGQLRKFLKEQMLDKHQTINEEELHVFDIVDTAEEAIQILRQRIVSRDSMTQVLNQE